MDKQRILIVSDSPTIYSGLSRWCREMAYRLTPYYDIAVAGWHYQNQRHLYPFHIYPITKMSSITHEQIAAAIDDFAPDIVLGLGDLDYFLNFYDLKKFFEKQKIIRWVVHLTVDGQPLNPFWKNALESMDDVFVCTNYGKKWLENLSDKVVAKVIPLGYSQTVFGDTNHREMLKVANNYKDTFVFIVNQQNTVRHNLNAVLWAYRAFLNRHPDAKVLMVMNCDPADPAGPNLKFELKRAHLEGKLILGDNDSVMKTKGDEEVNGLYNMADCIIAASCNEGFGLPIIEGMACGLPAIVNSYSALEELVTEATGWKVKPASFLVTSIGIRQAIVSHPGLVAAMEAAYFEWRDNKDKWANRREACKQHAAQFTWGDCAEAVKSALNESLVVKNVYREPKIGIICSWNEQCGIAEHTRLFVEKLKTPFMVFACEKRTPYETEREDEPYVKRCWTREFKQYDKLLEEIEKADISLVHIQHEFSFFERSSNLCSFIKELRRKGVKVIITFHTAANIHHILYALTEVVDYCTFCFKTKPEWLTDTPYSNISNSIPWCEDESKEIAREKLGIKSKHVIASNGFWQPYKGYLQIVHLLPELKKEFPDILYIIVGAHAKGHPYVKQVRDTIKALGVEENVLIYDKYAPKELLMDYLHASDVIIYNYHIQFKSSSAAVLIGLSAHRPVITTNSPMFDNIKNEAIKVDIGKVAKLHRAIKELLEDQSFGDILVKRADIFLRGITPEITAAKYEDLYDKLAYKPVHPAINPDICIGIPTYNDYERIDKGIQSILDNTDFMGRSYEIVVCDDGSAKRDMLHGLRGVCKKHGVRLIEHTQNRGIPSAWNTLTKATNAPYVVLFNDDIRVSDRNWLKAMLFALESNPRVGSVGLPLKQIDAKTEQPNPNYPLPDYNVGIGKVGAAVGCSFMFKREAYDKTTGFWEDLVSFYEEIDFGFQLVANGYMNLMLPYPAVEHWGSQTFTNNQELHLRNIDEDILSRQEYLNILREYSSSLTIKYEQHVQLSSWNKAYRMDYARAMFSKKWKTEDKFINPQAEVHNRLFANVQPMVYKWLDQNMQIVEKEV